LIFILLFSQKLAELHDWIRELDPDPDLGTWSGSGPESGSIA